MESIEYTDIRVHFFEESMESRNGDLQISDLIKHRKDKDETIIHFEDITLIQRISYEREDNKTGDTVEGDGIVIQTLGDDYILTSSSADIDEIREEIDDRRESEQSII